MSLGLASNNPEMEISIMRNLYDASLKGCVSSLKSLIQKDPLILCRVSLYPFSETPLHIASLLGHLELCQILLDINPNLAVEVNSEGHCPLHLASAKGHIEIVKALLLTDPETCLIRDKDDKLPLHFAVMRGRVGTIKELISAMPETETIRVMAEIDDHGSILHLCVCYNHLEALKILVESMRGDIDQFLSSKDKDGNNILDLAVQRGQIKIIKYLLSLSEMSETINTSKTEALRALHMFEHSPRDFTSNTIQHILTEERAQTSTNIVIAQQDHVNSPSNDPQQLLEQQAQINGHEQSQTPSPNNDPPQNQQPSQNIDPPQPPHSSPINDPQVQLVQSPISHPLQLTNPSPPNSPSQPPSRNPSPTNDPQQLLEQQAQINGHEQSQTPSPNNDPPQNQQPSQNIDPPQPPHSSPINDPQVQLVQSPISRPLQLTNPSPPNSPSQPPSRNPSPTNDPQQLLEQQAQINGHEQSQTPSPNNDPPQNQQPSQNIDPPRPPHSSPINDPQVQLVQSPISHPLQLTNPSPPNSPSQPPSRNPSPTNDPQHPQSPSLLNDPIQEITHSSPGLNPLQPPPPFSPSDDSSPTPSIANEQHEHNRWGRVESFCNKYLINQGYWIDKKTREQLMVAATVIATMTFQSVISPPGGVWEEDTTKGGYACPDYGFCEAGTAIVGYVWSPDYLKFIFFNSASFFASLCVLLVLVSGFPLHNKFIVWVLAVLMIVAITCMLLTYMWALGLVSPNHIFYRIRDLGYILVGIWSFLLFVVCLIQIARIVFWVRSRRRSSTNVVTSTIV